MKKLMDFLSLFGSTATLFCCALPALLAAVAGGAAVGSLLLAFPWLIPLSVHKHWLFLGAGALLIFNGFLTLKPHGAVACSVTGGKGCAVAGTFTRRMFWFSVTLYGIGVFTAYVLIWIIRFFEGS